jgi:hypothetical protein
MYGKNHFRKLFPEMIFLLPCNSDMYILFWKTLHINDKKHMFIIGNNEINV